MQKLEKNDSKIINKVINSLNEKYCDKLFAKIQDIGKKEGVALEDISEAKDQYAKMSLDEKHQYFIKVMNKIKQQNPAKYNKVSEKIYEKIKSKSSDLHEDYLDEGISVKALAVDLITYIFSYIILLLLNIPNIASWAIACLLSGIAHIGVLKHEENKEEKRRYF